MMRALLLYGPPGVAVVGSLILLGFAFRWRLRWLERRDDIAVTDVRLGLFAFLDTAIAVATLGAASIFAHWWLA